MTLTVIIVTIGRPACVRRCLEHLRDQAQPAEQVIVVDASSDDDTKAVVAEFPEVTYVRNRNGFGRMTGSRNLGLLSAAGQVIAYVDDDAYAHREWAEQIRRPYGDETVGAVGGQALNGQPGETARGVDQIGRFTASGVITGNFAADCGAPIEVDHLIGCNMSFRRSAIGPLGGFHEFYPGFCGTYEEADLCLRLKKSGWRLLYNPRATVDHEGAPRIVGKRFDLAYEFRVNRNHATLMVRNFGFASWRSIRYVAAAVMGRTVEAVRKTAGAWVRWAVALGGVAVGLSGGVAQRARLSDDRVRSDEVGRKIESVLSDASHECERDATPLASGTSRASA